MEGRSTLVRIIATLSVALASLLAPATRVGAHPTHADVRLKGLASWYGDAHHGRRTASGEVYDQNAMTAAHPSLPFGSVVRVTNLHNGRKVHVRVNDRGPVVDGRIIDLSRAAARAIGSIGSGVVPVRLEIVSQAPREARVTAAGGQLNQ